MAKNFIVTPNELDRTANNLSDHGRAYQQLASRVKEQLSILSSGWSGADNLAYVAKLTEFVTSLDRMGQKLDSMGEGMKRQGYHYRRRCEINVEEAQKLAH